MLICSDVLERGLARGNGIIVGKSHYECAPFNPYIPCQVDSVSGMEDKFHGRAIINHQPTYVVPDSRFTIKLELVAIADAIDVVCPVI